MKAKLFLVAAAWSLAVTVKANDPLTERFAVVERGNGIFKVIYKSNKQEDVWLTIVDHNGYVVLSERVKKVNGFFLPVNFSGMKPGTYTINLVSASGKFVKAIQYAGRSSDVEAVPVFHVTRLDEEGRYLVSFQSKHPEKIDFRILDRAGNTVYHELREVNDLALVYNLKNFSGTPTFKVTARSGKQVVVKK